MLSSSITVCIFAYNEEPRLERCVANFRNFFPIVVVDNMSTDGTVALAEKLGCKAIRVKNPGFIETAEVMNPVQEACETEYILIASVSEFVPLSLLEAYAAVANSRSHDVVRAYRESITAGMPIRISGGPGKKNPGELRFFRKGFVDYAETKVHDRGLIKTSEQRVLSLINDETAHFYQFRDYDCSTTEKKHCAYNDVLAKQRFLDGERHSLLRLLFIPAKLFIGCYLRNGAWKFGAAGFIQSYYRWQMEVGIQLRILEWQTNLDGANVVARNRASRDAMESQLLSQVSKHERVG